MEELNPTSITQLTDTPYYRVHCQIGWMWIFPVNDKPFQEHKYHYLSALKWCEDRDISVLLADMSQHQLYVKRHNVMFTSEEDWFAFTLAYGDLYVGTTVVVK